MCRGCTHLNIREPLRRTQGLSYRQHPRRCHHPGTHPAECIRIGYAQVLSSYLQVERTCPIPLCEQGLPLYRAPINSFEIRNSRSNLKCFTHLWGAAMVMRFLSKPTDVALQKPGSCQDVRAPSVSLFYGGEIWLLTLLNDMWWRLSAFAQLVCMIYYALNCLYATLNIKDPYPNTTKGSVSTAILRISKDRGSKSPR